MSLLNPDNEADRIFALRIGLTADSWINRALAANRFADVYGVGVTAKVSEMVMRGSLLQPWTDSMRKAFGMEFSSLLADNFGKTFSQIDGNLKRAFDTYGITELDWDLFRVTPLLENNGVKFADLTKGNRFQQMIMTEMEYAVPVPDARVRGIMKGGADRGTPPSETWRSAMMLKSFPVSVIATHFYRAAYQSGMADKSSYSAALLLSTTALGAVALQAKDIASGRNPRPMDSPEFWGAAFAQGGGAGILGDFMFSDVNRFGSGTFKTFLGPTAELGDKVASLTLGNIQEAIKGEETNILGETARFVNRYTPDTWQIELFKSALINQARMAVDPNAKKSFRRIMQKRQREFNQGYWWKPGQLLPEGLK